jgi:predicted nucleic acid-binding protein
MAGTGVGPGPDRPPCRCLAQIGRGSELRGNLISDAHLAALAVEYGVGVCSADSDFARFDGVTWINPIRLSP